MWNSVQVALVAYQIWGLNYLILGILGTFATFQSLTDRWAGGKLFTREIAWLTYGLTALYVFVVYVVPTISLQLLIGIVVVAALVAIAIWSTTWDTGE